MIDVSRPFSLFARCEVIYDGRAYSTLEVGNYLIIHKDDGSLQIHSSQKITPSNYQGPRSSLEQRGHLLISKSKKETITIIIHQIINLTYLKYWSDSEIVITRTEQDLVDKLFYNWPIEGEFMYIFQEYQTELGNIDLLGVTFDMVFHVIEVKRVKASIPHVTQLKRYIDILAEHHDTEGYLASPEIGERAMAYLEKCGYHWIQVDFDYA